MHAHWGWVAEMYLVGDSPGRVALPCSRACHMLLTPCVLTLLSCTS